MKIIEDALELADDVDECPYFDKGTGKVIRRLVEELDKAEERNLKIVRKNEKLLGEFFRVKEELECALDYIKQYQSEERHGIK